jgi:hypothetical protein
MTRDSWLQMMEDSTPAAAGCTGKGLDGPGSLAMGAGDGRRMDNYFTASPANAAGGKGRHNIEGVFSSAMAKRAS